MYTCIDFATDDMWRAISSQANKRVSVVWYFVTKQKIRIYGKMVITMKLCNYK